MYASGHAAPVALLLKNPTPQPIAGYVSIGAGRDNHVVIRQPVSVPAGCSLRVDTVMRPGTPGDERAMPAGDVAPMLWIADDGRVVGRSTLNGTRVSTQHLSADELREHRTAASSPLAVLVIRMNAPPATTDSVGRVLGSALDRVVADCTLGDVDDLPRSVDSYGPYPIVAIGDSLNAMDVSQQRALIEYLRRGGNLIVWATSADDLRNNWLTPLLPVNVIGQRLAGALQVDGVTRPISLSQNVNLLEAVERRSTPPAVNQIAFRNGEYVYAATKSVGLGRLIFTCVPPSAMDPNNAAVRAMWRSLLPNDIDAAAAEPAVGSSSADDRVLSELLGRAAPPIAIPALVAGGYLLVAAAGHTLFRGSRRPVGHLVILLTSVGCAAGLVGFTVIHTGAPVLSVARLSSLELGVDGTGRQTEKDAFIGPGNASLTLSQISEPGITAWPAEFDPRNAPVVQPLPFKAQDPGIREDGFDRTWRFQKTLSHNQMTVAAQFTADGLHLLGRQGFTSAVAQPLLAWGRQTMRINDLPAGTISANVELANLNPPGVFTHGGGLVGATDRLRAELLQGWAKSRSADEASPMLLGWLDSNAVPPLMRLDGSSTRTIVNEQILIKVPASLEPSPIGATVRIDGPFNRAGRVADAAIPPLDATGSADGNQPLDWVMSIVPPAGLGMVKPTRATLSLDLDTPQHIVTVQAGQFAGGASDPKSFSAVTAAPVLATWSHGIGHQQIAFDVTPADLSPAGLLVLRISIQPAGSAATARWAVHGVNVSLVGTIIGKPSAH